MKKYLIVGSISSFFLLFFFLKDTTSNNALLVGVSEAFPPLIFYEKGELVGFEIDLMKLVAAEIQKPIVFQGVSFNTIFASLMHDRFDIGIAGIECTEKREQNVDCTLPYYWNSISVISRKAYPIHNKQELKGKKIASMLGSTAISWLKKNNPLGEIVLFDTTQQAIEALQLGQCDGIMVAQTYAQLVTQQYTSLDYSLIEPEEFGYSIIFKKGSPLKTICNDALRKLAINGSLEQLKQKWFGSPQDLNR